MPRRFRLLVFALIGEIALACAPCAAQEIEPRAYSNAPIDLNFLIAGYGYSKGGLFVDPAIPLENANLDVDSVVMAYARSFELWNRSAKFDVIAPYASLSGTADFMGQPRQRDTSGWADPRLRVSINLVGAPALTLKEFAGYQQDLIVGLSLQAWAPLGKYEEDKLVNVGSNRWVVKPELGLSKAIGRWIFDFAAAAALYEDNDEWQVDKTREQNPIYSAQAAVTYSFGRGAWMALGGTYYTGGRTTVDGVSGDDLQKNSRFGLVVTAPVNRNNSIKFYANTGVSTRTGTDFDAVGLAWQYRWGGGL